MARTAQRTVLAILAVLALAVAGAAQGVVMKSGGVVLCGSASNCTQPATIDMKKVAKATPEYKTIKSEGVPKGSARYDLLVAQMVKRIKQACSDVAKVEGKDCIVRKGDIEQDNGLAVSDLTDKVIEKVESSS